MQAPIISTDRLTLGPHRADDLDALVAMWGDPAVYRMIGGRPRTREDVWIRLLRAIGQWTLFGYGSWVLRDRTSGAFVGEIGLIEARRDIAPPLDAPEMSWVLAPAAHGRGLADEGLRAVLDWCDAQGIVRTQCIIDPANTRSIRLARAVGYRMLHGEAHYRDAAIAILAREGVSPADRATRP